MVQWRARRAQDKVRGRAHASMFGRVRLIPVTSALDSVVEAKSLHRQTR